ncbi:hypothetical protein ABH931_007413 [Streptacidiphilus sp. MAP12-33]|uniref:hypothetical protein n=1 Tax=Streptacidiphilus sp. MAP12-33 TaxID=3156266 RepID=UPI0035137765
MSAELGDHVEAPLKVGLGVTDEFKVGGSVSLDPTHDLAVAVINSADHGVRLPGDMAVVLDVPGAPVGIVDTGLDLGDSAVEQFGDVGPVRIRVVRCCATL